MKTGALCLGLMLAFAVPAFAGAEPDLFPNGAGFIATGADKKPSAEDCRSCHVEATRQWSASRHAEAWTNPLFRESYDPEPRDRCVFCHAPVKEAAQSEGVGCAACHIRGGEILTTKESPKTAHKSRVTPTLRDATFCAGCHQFNFADTKSGTVVTEPQAAQNTFREWQAYQAGGGPYTCQQCHMPGGDHTFRGASDLAFLKAAVTVSAERTVEGSVFVIETVETGHNLPTGDVFRHLTLEVKTPGVERYLVVATFGRTFRTVVDKSTGKVTQALDNDTSLKPFEKRTVDVNSAGPLRYRLRYHRTAAYNEERSKLPEKSLVVTLVEGDVP